MKCKYRKLIVADFKCKLKGKHTLNVNFYIASVIFKDITGTS